MIRREAIHIPFRYAAGKQGSRFLTALRDGQTILGSPCPTCQRVHVPACSFCPDCGGDLRDTVPVGPEGEVLCWTDVPGKGTFALVRLDGADTAMLHKMIPGAGAIGAGARVRARFAGEPSGSIFDIEGFEPVEERP